MARRGGTWWSGRPGLFLALWFLLAATQLTLNALRPPLPTTNVGILGLLAVVALVLAAVSAASVLLPSERVVVPILLVSGEILLTVVLITAASGQGQLMASLYMLALNLIAAVYVRRRAMLVVLVLGAVLYIVGAAVNVRLDSPGYVVFAVTVVAVVTLLVSSLVESLRNLAQHDVLTGALNRSGLESAASLAHALASRDGRDTAIVEIDLDGFKQYNDAFGHAAGDERLVQVVGAWQSVLRSTDLLARVGGDEFVLVLPGASTEEAEDLISRMRSACDVPWTAGVSDWSKSEGLRQAFLRADRRLYEGKARRRPPA